MHDLKHLNCHTGIVSSNGNRTVVTFTDNQKLRTCFLNATTQFLGPIDNGLALRSLREGLSVNVWLSKNARIVPYASVNRR